MGDVTVRQQLLAARLDSVPALVLMTARLLLRRSQEYDAADVLAMLQDSM
jgi:hypothetical protein